MKILIKFAVVLLLIGNLYANMPIRAEHTGSWFNPNQAGHGLSVEVLDNENVLVYWYTYFQNGYPLWIVGQGKAVGNSVTLDSYVYQGMEWGNWEPDKNEQYYFGTMTFTVNGCDNVTFGYDSVADDFGSGEIEFIRLSSAERLKCSDSPFAGVHLTTLLMPDHDIVGAGFTFVLPDAQFATVLFDSGAAVIMGELTPGQANATIYSFDGGASTGASDLSATEGSFMISGEGNSIIGVRDEHLSMHETTFSNGNYQVDVNAGRGYGNLRINNGSISGNIDGCGVSGSIHYHDQDFDVAEFAATLSGCAGAGNYHGIGSNGIIILNDSWRGLLIKME